MPAAVDHQLPFESRNIPAVGTKTAALSALLEVVTSIDEIAPAASGRANIFATIGRLSATNKTVAVAIRTKLNRRRFHKTSPTATIRIKGVGIAISISRRARMNVNNPTKIMRNSDVS